MFVRIVRRIIVLNHFNATRVSIYAKRKHSFIFPIIPLKQECVTLSGFLTDNSFLNPLVIRIANPVCIIRSSDIVFMLLHGAPSG